MKRELKSLYYKLNASPNTITNFDNYFKGISTDDFIETELIKDFGFYIFDIVRKENYVLFTVAKVNTAQEIKIDDIKEQKRAVIDKEDTQGLATDAQFLYSFNNKILVQKRGQSQTNLEELRMILSRKINIDLKNFNFALVKDTEGISKLDKLNQVHDLVFNIAIPRDLSLFADQVEDTNAAIELAKKLSGDSVEMKIHGENLEKRGIKNTVELLKRYRDYQNVNVKSLSIYGDNELIDLARHKLSYYRKFETEELTNKEIYQFLEEAYQNKKDYLDAYVEKN